MDNITESTKWIDFAENDYEAAILLENSHKPLLEIICFHCQQSAEKFLKSYLIRRGGEVKKTHNLGEILKECVKFDSEFNSIKDSCIDLTDYAVETRYSYPFEIDINDMKKAINDMKIIRSFVKSKI